MDHLIGQRFSLISKSEIRYVGTLHEINPEQSTIALEEVFSFGTEDRNVENFIPPSQQKFEYIVFRGSDVKDIKVAEEQSENKPPSPPPPPNDPAILNSSRPGPPPQDRRESPFPPPGYPAPGQFNGYYPNPQFGRGYGPPPPHMGYGPGYGPPFHPPPGYFGPPGQGFPQGPNQFPHQQPPPPPIGPPGQQQQPQQPQRQQSPSNASSVPTAPIPSKPTQELPVEKSAAKDGSQTPIPVPTPSTTVQQSATNPSQALKSFAAAAASPAQSKSTRVTPAMPLQVNQKSFTPPVSSIPPPMSTTNGSTKPAAPPTSIEEASRQAKEAVAAAMAKLNPPTMASKPVVPDTSVDTITKRLNDLNTGTGSNRGRGGYRGGRGARSTSGGQSRKVEIPKSDFDFESANAKFNKEDLIKEAIASGSPLGEHPDTSLDAELIANGSDAAGNKDSGTQVSGYNKSSSFFDNISSEARDREEAGIDPRQHGRALRGQEFKKNIETFGQGNVDSGYRGRGRGYGNRGYRGGGGYNGRGYRGGNGYRGGRGRGGHNQQQAQQAEQ